jgi:hypothetical protein
MIFATTDHVFSPLHAPHENRLDRSAEASDTIFLRKRSTIPPHELFRHVNNAKRLGKCIRGMDSAGDVGAREHKKAFSAPAIEGAESFLHNLFL